jgi:putative transposase
MNRALKLRLYPTSQQQILLDKILGSCRFIYNKMLDERIKVYAELKDNHEELYKHQYKSVKDYKEEYEFLKEVDAYALCQSQRHLITAYANFYKSLKGLRKGQKAGFPKFKSKKSHTDSYECRMSIKCSFSSHKIKVPKITEITFRHKDIKPWFLKSTLKCITIRKTASGKYYASCLFEGLDDNLPKVKNIKKVKGLDMSLEHFYVDEQNQSPDFNRNYRQLEDKLAWEQKKLSRKTRGSRNYEKQRIQVAKIHENIANKRRDFNDKLSLKLVKENDAIVVETLSLKGMSQALSLGKSVMDLGYSSFVQMLKYKSEHYGKYLIMADKWFASSKTCNQCGYIKKDLLLQEREWVCPVCGAHHFRDQNAGINLRNYGLKILSERQESTPVDTKALAELSFCDGSVKLGDRNRKLTRL